MAEQALVPEDVLLDVPEGVDDDVAATPRNAGPAAWLALGWNANGRGHRWKLVVVPG